MSRAQPTVSTSNRRVWRIPTADNPESIECIHLCFKELDYRKALDFVLTNYEQGKRWQQIPAASEVIRRCNLVSHCSDSECFRSPALRCSLQQVVLWFCSVLVLGGTLLSNWTSRTGDYSKARGALSQS